MITTIPNSPILKAWLSRDKTYAELTKREAFHFEEMIFAKAAHIVAAHHPNMNQASVEIRAALHLLTAGHPGNATEPEPQPAEQEIITDSLNVNLPPWVRKWAILVAILLSVIAFCAIAKAEPEPAPSNVVYNDAIHALIVRPGILAQGNAGGANSRVWFWNGSNAWIATSSGNPFPVTCVSGCSAAGAFSDNAAFTVGTTAVSPIGGYFTSGADPTLTSGSAARARIDAHSYLFVDCAVGCAGGTFNNNSDAVATSATNGQTAAWLYAFNGTTFDRLQVDGSKFLKVNCAAGCSGGSTTPADAFANPTTAGLQFDLLAGFNGTTWDRLRSSTANGLQVDVTRVQGSVAVTGTFWQATQPVSAASLPLPTGAATAAKQPALGTAGTPSADVITVQGTASMTALKVDGSAVTQPVSAASLPLPTGASTSANQCGFSGTPCRVTGNAGGNFDGATNAAPPANAVLQGLIAANALPSAATVTDTVAPMADKFGRQIVIPVAMRDLIKPASVQTTTATQTALLAAQGAGVFADLISLTITTESATACTVALSDGTTTYKVNIANQQGAGATINLPTPLPATSANTAWNVTGCASVTLDYIAEFALNK